MDPRIVAIAGPLRASVFPLRQEDISVGRDTANQLVIDDISVSRRHCLLKQQNGSYQIIDLDSHNGTFVNGIPTKGRLLEHGDRIKIGNSILLFILRDVEAALNDNEIQLEDDTLITNSAMRISIEDTLYSMALDLSTLLKIGQAITSVRGLAALERALLEELFAVTPAEHGAVLLVKETTDEFSSAFTLSKWAELKSSIRVSRTILEQVVRERVAVISNDVLESDRFGQVESLISGQIRSLLCVPLVLYGHGIGVIYLSSSSLTARFNRDHLQLVTAVANVAAGVLKNALHIEWLEGENQRLRTESAIEHSMIGESLKLQEVYRFIAKAAPTDSTVLIRGESGTGKELVARAIHQNSTRAAKPFLAVNCATLSDTLLESELFGYEKGAFTGASTTKKGKLEVADGGTIFLDEVGEMLPSTQAKFLRVLQEHEFERVGGTRSLKADIRVIAATNKNLEDAMSQGSFRRDFYFRLNVLSLAVPPLRERREDISLLVNYFIAKYSQKCKRQVMGISAETRAQLIYYDWPGNVRELENAIERAVVLGSTMLLQPEDLPETILEAKPSTETLATKYNEAVNEAKRQIISRAFAQANGSFAEAAKLLGVHPNNLYRLMRNLQLKLTYKA